MAKKWKKPDGGTCLNLKWFSDKNAFYFYAWGSGIEHQEKEGYIAGFYRDGYRLYELYEELGEFFKNDEREQQKREGS